MGKNNKELLKIAEKYLGQGGAKFRKYCGLPGGAAWCNAFVTFVFHEAGNSGLYCNGTKQTYCPNSIKWCNKNLAQLPIYLAMPGDVIYFDWDKNGVPNHIGFVRSKNTTDSIYTIEGNTSNKVMKKTRPSKYVQAVYRPHYKASFTLKKLTVDGDCGYNTIAGLQKALGINVDGVLGLATVKALQKKAGATVDGQWGSGTSKAVQKMVGVKVDGAFGKNSVKALQNWINKNVFAEVKPKPVSTKLVSYRVDVDLTNQIATVYGVYDNKSTKVLMSEFVSTARKGHTTPVGNFKISSSKGRKAKARTAKMSSGKSFAEYLVRFHGAKCMHTVPYKKRQTTGHVDKAKFNKLGTPQSAGCVRMPWKMAHYIYTTCPVGTPVRVFKGKAGAYPGGKPKKYTATTDIDPTYKKA